MPFREVRRACISDLVVKDYGKTVVVAEIGVWGKVIVCELRAAVHDDRAARAVTETSDDLVVRLERLAFIVKGHMTICCGHDGEVAASEMWKNEVASPSCDGKRLNLGPIIVGAVIGN